MNWTLTVGFLALGLASLPAAAQVMPDVMGTEDSAEKWMKKAKDYVKENGIEKIIESVGEEGKTFHESIHNIAIHRVNDNGRIFVERHNVYDSLVDIDMTDQQDLNGKYFIQSFHEDVQKEGGGTTDLRLQIAKTGNVKKSWCMNEWAPGYEGEYFITICY